MILFSAAAFTAGATSSIISCSQSHQVTTTCIFHGRHTKEALFHRYNNVKLINILFLIHHWGAAPRDQLQFWPAHNRTTSCYEGTSNCMWIRQQSVPGYEHYSSASIDSRGLESVHSLQLSLYECSFSTDSSPENRTSVSYLHTTYLPWKTDQIKESGLIKK